MAQLSLPLPLLDRAAKLEELSHEVLSTQEDLRLRTREVVAALEKIKEGSKKIGASMVDPPSPPSSDYVTAEVLSSLLSSKPFNISDYEAHSDDFYSGDHELLSEVAKLVEEVKLDSVKEAEERLEKLRVELSEMQRSLTVPPTGSDGVAASRLALPGDCVSEERAREIVSRRLKLEKEAEESDLARHARILPIHTSAMFKPPNTFIPPSFYQYVGLPSPVGPPSDAITPGTDLGNCFAFGANKGKLGLHLPRRIKLKSVSVEHVDSRISPDVSSAPKHFTVYGFKNIRDAKSSVGRVNFGSFMYRIVDHDEDGEEEGVEGMGGAEAKVEAEGGGGKLGNRQHFDVTNVDSTIRVLVLQIDDNHGREDYTCLYRFRVFEKEDEDLENEELDYDDAEVDEESKAGKGTTVKERKEEEDEGEDEGEDEDGLQEPKEEEWEEGVDYGLDKTERQDMGWDDNGNEEEVGGEEEGEGEGDEKGGEIGLEEDTVPEQEDIQEQKAIVEVGSDSKIMNAVTSDDVVESKTDSESVEPVESIEPVEPVELDEQDDSTKSDAVESTTATFEVGDTKSDGEKGAGAGLNEVEVEGLNEVVKEKEIEVVDNNIWGKGLEFDDGGG